MHTGTQQAMGQVFSRVFGIKSVQQADKHEEPPEQHCCTPTCSLSAKSSPTSSTQSPPEPQTPVATKQSAPSQSPSPLPNNYSVPPRERSPLVRKLLVPPPAQKRKRAAISIKTNESNKKFRHSVSSPPEHRHPRWILTEEGVHSPVLSSRACHDAS